MWRPQLGKVHVILFCILIAKGKQKNILVKIYCFVIKNLTKMYVIGIIIK